MEKINLDALSDRACKNVWKHGFHMEKIDWNALSDRAYKDACKHGFHNEKLSIETDLMLIISEISEAVEADRRNRYAEFEHFLRAIEFKDKLYFPSVYKDLIKNSVQDEFADIIIECLDLVGKYKVDLNSKYNPHVYDYEHFMYQSFSEGAFELCEIVMRGRENSKSLLDIISYVLNWCEFFDIDIMAHVDLKMKYNEARSFKHGKKY